ncbi:hypothetical protein XENORESO_002167 [Xenotaenia resolanae]|uniref:Uncharacterized protein n=1 Tax=Xenotaenia resolanae TaxID=208358 RepID=A0ABV0WWK6_9TELE
MFLSSMLERLRVVCVHQQSPSVEGLKPGNYLSFLYSCRDSFTPAITAIPIKWQGSVCMCVCVLVFAARGPSYIFNQERGHFCKVRTYFWSSLFSCYFWVWGNGLELRYELSLG